VWTCIEFEVDRAGGLQTWVDGALIEGLVIDGSSTPDVDSQWLRTPWSPQLSDVRIGWESYGGEDAALSFDDVAISAEPIGCLDRSTFFEAQQKISQG
jgi:hypothetical protein